MNQRWRSAVGRVDTGNSRRSFSIPVRRERRETKRGQSVSIALGELILLDRREYLDEQRALRKLGARLAGLASCNTVSSRKPSMAS